MGDPTPASCTPNRAGANVVFQDPAVLRARQESRPDPEFSQETFESGLRKTVQWYLDHPDWIEAVRKRGGGQAGPAASNAQIAPAGAPTGGPTALVYVGAPEGAITAAQHPQPNITTPTP